MSHKGNNIIWQVIPDKRNLLRQKFLSYSNGNEAVILIIFATIIFIISTLILLKYADEKETIILEFSKKFQHSSHKKNKTVTPNINELNTNGEDRILRLASKNTITVSLSNKKYTVLNLPSTLYYTESGNSNKIEGYNQYILMLSQLLKNLADDSMVESRSLNVLSSSISDYINIYVKLDNYNNYNINDENNTNINVSEYLKSIDITLNQLHKENFNNDNYYNPVTELNQKNYLNNLSSAIKKVQAEEHLSEDIKLLAQIITDEIIAISKNHILSISDSDYKRSKPVLINMLNKTSVEYNTKLNLTKALNTFMLNPAKATTFIDTLLTILRNNPEGIKDLKQEDKNTLIKTINSITFITSIPINKLIEYNLTSKYNCLKENGVYENGKCLNKNILIK